MEYEQVPKYAEEPARHAPDPFRGDEISGDESLRRQLDRRLPPELVAHSPRPGDGGLRYRTRSEYAFGETGTVGEWKRETAGLQTHPAV